MNAPARPEFSHIVRPLAVDGDAATVYARDATPDECAALAKRFGFQDLDGFRISVRLVPERGSSDFRLYGRIVARVVQNCVVTLEPVLSEVDREFELLLREESAEDDFADDADDDFEIYSGDAIDIGEICAVELALGLDPYPRVPVDSIEFSDPNGDTRDGAGKPAKSQGDSPPGNRPFEVLAVLKRTE